MNLAFFVKSIIIGFILSLPLGPANIITIRRTLSEGKTRGFISGMGAATADSFYAYVAALGLSLVMSFFVREKTTLQFGGGIILLLIGIRYILAKPSNKYKDKDDEAGSYLLKTYGSTFLLTLANPLTIFAFTALFAGFGLAVHSRKVITSSFIALGVFSGAMIWWFTLSHIVSYFRKFFDNKGMLWLNRISGIIIAFIGVLALVGVI